MADTRRVPLPEDKNPMLIEERAPNHEILVERRCLGQTELKVKPGQVNTSNATKPDNLGVLDYAHLRVPLPSDLSSSGIFAKGSNRKYPDAYFLMRRSSDGYVSATGMFKAAFPYASTDEELAEKDFVKGLPESSSEEVAGNVWIHPNQALSLGEEYGIKLWVAALLDPEPITHGTSDPKKAIKSPPAFRFKGDTVNGLGRSPDKLDTGRRSTRGSRSIRSASPSKTPARKIATPRKARKGRGGLSKVDEDGASVADSEAHSVNGDIPSRPTSSRDTVKVEVEKTTQTSPDDPDEELESTRVNVELPVGYPEMKLPSDPQEMLVMARDMVDKAGEVSSGKGKRKAEEMEEDDDEDVEEAPKRAKAVHVELRKEKIRRRALTGIIAGLAFGTLIPSLMTAFPWS
ncbi:hypothetical protein B0A48_09743 [Cryoendolithus antarcticus]|uniref:HTH APSES-type domain-containing protein n=1 Tax=Cryoendolithus antarcticus TaxID=1507870 RepID=A0A1V8T311_9PEZI|nr:hypothetical protein B0A48_09743 [Cryoendolithus antarcticus]